MLNCVFGIIKILPYLKTSILLQLCIPAKCMYSCIDSYSIILQRLVERSCIRVILWVEKLCEVVYGISLMVTQDCNVL